VAAVCGAWGGGVDFVGSVFVFQIQANRDVCGISLCGGYDDGVATLYDGEGYNIEFKRLVDWYVANAKPGEKLVCTWSPLLKLLGEKHKDNFIGFGSIKGKTFEEFIENCYKADVTYVTWNIRGSYKKMRKHLVHIGSQLLEPRDIGPFKLVERIEINKKIRWINIFRLREKPEAANP